MGELPALVFVELKRAIRIDALLDHGLGPLGLQAHERIDHARARRLGIILPKNSIIGEAQGPTSGEVHGRRARRDQAVFQLFQLETTPRIDEARHALPSRKSAATRHVARRSKEW